MATTPYPISTFRGGSSDENDKGIRGSFKMGWGLDIHSRDDVIRCASAMANIAVGSGVVNDLVQYFVTARDGTTYGFGKAGSIYAISGEKSDPVVSFAYNDENGEIKGAAEWQESDGINYLYWATNTSVARVAMNGAVDLPWAGATQDYKTTLDGALYHPMGNAAGRLNIGNANYLATIDYDGNYDIAATNLRPGNIVKTLEERDDYVSMGSERRDNAEEGHIWTWIPTAQNYVQKKRIPVKGVNALITAEIPLVQGGTDGEIFPADFLNSVPLARIPGGGSATPGGVTIDNDIATFGISGGDYPGLWQFGRRHKDRVNALNLTYRLTDTVEGSSVASIGAVTTANGLVFAAWGTNESDSVRYGIDVTSATTLATAVYEGLEFDGGSPWLDKQFSSVKITFNPLPAGTSFSIKYKRNRQSTWQYAVFGNSSTVFSTAGETETIATLAGDAHTLEVGAELTPSGASTPDIQSITPYIISTDNA